MAALTTYSVLAFFLEPLECRGLGKTQGFRKHFSFELVKRHLDEGALERHKKVAGFRKRPRFSGIPSVFEGVLRTTKEVWRNAV